MPKNSTRRKQAVRREVPVGNCTVKIGGRHLTANTHAVVIPDRPTAQEKHAAQEIAHHLKLVTGEAIPVLRELQAEGRIPIFVGKCRGLDKLKVKVDSDALGTEGICIRTAGTKLVLAGGQRGVLYACYTFLEDFLGVHWLAPDCTVYPREGAFDLRDLDVCYVPPLEYRQPFTFCGFDADWAVRNKSNGEATRLDAVRGGKTVYEGFVHTFFPLVPPKKFFAAHPEYFSELDGQRRHERGQLCLTNPEVEDLTVRTAKHWLRKNPEANIISVSQNDWHGNCQCADCQAVDAEEGSPAGTLLRFVNRVAERLEEEFPHVAIDTLAYQYTRRPPKRVRPRPNVIVRLCSIECSFSQPLGTGEQNRSFREDIEGWGKICRRLYIWDYVTNFHHYLQPHPNLRVLQPNIQFFVRNGVRGIFEQGGFQSPGGELQELRTWLLGKLLWNPDADLEQLMATFLEGYYGPAAPHLRQYIDLMHDAVERTGTYLGCYCRSNAPFLSQEILAEAGELFDCAEEAVRDDSVLYRRVRTARMGLLYVALVQSASGYREETDALVVQQPADAARLKELEADARAAGVTHIREGKPNLKEWLAAQRKRSMDLPVERLRSSTLEACVLPESGGRLWRLRLLSEGREVLKIAGTPDALQPNEEGYEEFSESGYRSPGWNESYAVVERSPRRILLQADLRSGLRLVREIKLSPKQAKVSIASTLTNPGRKDRQACLRIHPSLSMASVASTSVWTKSADGEWHRRPLARPADPEAPKELWLQGAECPAGEWALVDEASDLAILNRFSRREVDSCLLSWSGRDGRANLELYSHTRLLKPGESLRIRHSYEAIRHQVFTDPAPDASVDRLRP